jgi:hypothetical protein
MSEQGFPLIEGKFQGWLGKSGNSGVKRDA